MADIQNKIKEAKQSGYTNEEIFSHVSKLPEYQSKIKEALDAKYSPDEILVHLSGDPSFAAPQARANVGAEEPIKPKVPSSEDVVIESLKRVPVGIAESFAQFPENVANLAKMGYGAAMTAAGKPELAPTVEAPPARIEQFLTQQGALKPLEGMTPSQRILSAGIQGAAAGMLQPVQGIKQLGANVLKGLVAGGAGEGVTQATGSELAGLATAMVAPGLMTKAGKAKTAALEKEQKLNAVRDQTIKESQKAGYVIPLGNVTPSMTNVMLEGIAGKEALQQAFSTKNQQVTNKLARQALGVAEDAPLTTEAMKQIRNDEFQKGYAPLKQIGNIGSDINYMFDLNKIKSKYAGGSTSFPKAVSDEVNKIVDDYKVSDFDSRHALDAIKKLREDSAGSFRKGDTGLAKAQKEIANALERQIERHLVDIGNPDAQQMLANFKAARQRMAISHSVEDALHKGAGTVDAKELAKAYRNDKYLSGELETIAKFADTFAPVAKTPLSFGTPGANRIQAGMQTFGAAMGGASGGIPGAIAGGIAPVAVPYAIRKAMASKLMQQGVAPSYRNVLANITAQDITQPQLLNALLGLQQAQRNQQ